MTALFTKISVFLFGLITAFFPVNYIAPKNIPTNLTPQPAPIARPNNPTNKAVPKIPLAKVTPKKLVADKRALGLLGIKEVATTTPVAPPPEAKVESKTLIPLETLNETSRQAMVNILCTTKLGGDFNPISGSGIIIDKHGVILTNAHVAQYMLLRDYGTKNFISCAARAGSPAMPAYKIELLYLPANWLTDNAKMIKQQIQEGTGENDYALFLITGSATENPLPDYFPFVAIDADQKNITGDVPMLLIGYPANFLGGIATQRNLWIVSSPSYLTKLLYFNEKENIDAFSVGANIVAQKGVSGGAAINQLSGRVEGILSTISGGDTTGSRDLSAISLAHINRSFKKNTGKSLDEFLSGDLKEFLQDFNKNSVPNLTKTLIDALESTKPN